MIDSFRTPGEANGFLKAVMIPLTRPFFHNQCHHCGPHHHRPQPHSLKPYTTQRITRATLRRPLTL